MTDYSGLNYWFAVLNHQLISAVSYSLLLELFGSVEPGSQEAHIVWLISQYRKIFTDILEQIEKRFDKFDNLSLSSFIPAPLWCSCELSSGSSMIENCMYSAPHFMAIRVSFTSSYFISSRVTSSSFITFSQHFQFPTY